MSIIHLATDSVMNKQKFRQTSLSLSKPLCLALAFSATSQLLSGCQTVKPSVQHDMQTINTIDPRQPVRLNEFNIRGKMGVVVPQSLNAQGKSGSAFYVWAQQDDRFAIDITGALGIGHTVIEYNGSEATLVSERTGEIKATSPEDLLTRATGWQAPISQLPYWISGHSAPSDAQQTLDANGRLHTAINGKWSATFSYADTSRLPKKIKVQRPDGYRVILTMEHDLS